MESSTATTTVDLSTIGDKCYTIKHISLINSKTCNELAVFNVLRLLRDEQLTFEINI